METETHLAMMGWVAGAFLLAWWACRSLRQPGSWLYLLDHPNERSLHARPTPRGGGLGIWLAFFVGWAGVAWRFDPAPVWGWVAVALLLLAGVSYLDDRRGLTPGQRLAVQTVAAALVIGAGVVMTILDLPGVGVVRLRWGLELLFTLLALLWMTNLYNFMDGMDGFAGGMGFFGALFLALLGWRGEDFFYMWTALLLAAVNLGFLMENFPPARLFMGDVGAVPMGFMMGVMSVWGVHEGLFPLWAALLIFSPFVVDATVTLIRRAWRRERVWQAHRSHYYQRLVGLGWGHRRTVLAEYAVMLVAGLSTWWMCTGGGFRRVWWGLLAWALFYAAVTVWIHGREKRSSSG